MSLTDWMKDASNFIKGKNQQKNEYFNERKEILENLPISQLQKIVEEFDIDYYNNEFINQMPQKEDMISTIVLSQKLETDMLKDFIYKSEEEYTTTKKEPTMKYNYNQYKEINKTETMINKSTKKESIDINNVFDKFASDIINCLEIDSDLFITSMKNIQELKKEMYNDTINKDKVNQLLNWFRNNNEYLGTLSMPYTYKITEWILQ